VAFGAFFPYALAYLKMPEEKDQDIRKNKAKHERK
jgi:hypothetical protein